MSVENNTNKLTEDILDTLESFIENGYVDVEREFEDYIVRIYTTTDRNESIVEWNYVLKDSDSYLVNEQEVIDRVYDSISY